MNGLDPEEREILEAFEEGKLERASEADLLKTRHQRYAQEMVGQERLIHLRLSERDLLRLRRKAREAGIPYETLAAQIIHRYVEEVGEID